MRSSARPGDDRYGAVVFDLFGTLVEFEPSRLPTIEVDGMVTASTVPRFEEQLRRYVPEVGVARFVAALRAVSEALRLASRDTLVETASRARFRRALVDVGCDHDRLDEAASVLSRAHHQAIATATTFSETRREVLMLAAARGPVAVVSNFDDTASAFAILARHAILPTLATVVVSEAVGLRKPHPAMLATALATLDVTPPEVLVVGDSFEADVGVAHALGADAAWIDVAGAGVPATATAPRHVLRRLEDLLPILAQRRRGVAPAVPR